MRSNFIGKFSRAILLHLCHDLLALQEVGKRANIVNRDYPEDSPLHFDRSMVRKSYLQRNIKFDNTLC